MYKKTDGHALHLPMNVSHWSIYNMSKQCRLVTLEFPKPSLPFNRKLYFSLIVCAMMEFAQFAGITFGKAKGRLEVTVSAWVSGWPLGTGGGNHSHRGIVCCCARKRPGLNEAHQNQKDYDRGQKMTTYYLPLKIFPVSYMIMLKRSLQVFSLIYHNLLTCTCPAHSII